MSAFLESLCHTIWNMSVIASIVIAAVLLVRLALKRAPKAVSYGLWFVVLFRLVCPVSFQSAFSLFGLRGSGKAAMEFIPRTFVGPALNVNSVTPALPDPVNPAVQAALPNASPDAALNWTLVLTLIWAAGVIILLAYSLVSYLLLKRRLGTAVLVRDNIRQTDLIKSPFVCGFKNPQIFLPVSLENCERDYIICHEQTHIRRRDYLVKPLWYFALCLHWFNPIAWLAFYLMNKDMEMSCDEAVLRKMGEGIKTDYSESLLALSVTNAHTRVSKLLGSPLAFGETGTMARVKNVLKFKRPVTGLIAAAVIVAVIAATALAADPVEAAKAKSLAAQFLEYKTEYVGDNSKVGGILSLLTYPEGLAYDHFELKTDAEPYGITVFLRPTADQFAITDPQRGIPMHNTAVLFSLIGNVAEIDYRITEFDDKSFLAFHRDSVNEMYGRDVREFAADEAGFEKFLNRNITVPVTVEASYGLMKFGLNGEVIASCSPLWGSDKQLAEETIRSFMLKSAAWEARDIGGFDECYAIMESKPDGTVMYYYAFIYEGKACLQAGKDGQFSVIDGTLFQQIKALMDRIAGVSTEVEENLSAIMSSPLESSNAADYIEAHPDEYRNILALGDEALIYMLSCFEKGEENTLKGHIMMSLCIDILGTRSETEGQLLMPTEWYKSLKAADGAEG